MTNEGKQKRCNLLIPSINKNKDELFKLRLELADDLINEITPRVTKYLNDNTINNIKYNLIKLEQEDGSNIEISLSYDGIELYQDFAEDDNWLSFCESLSKWGFRIDVPYYYYGK